LDLIVTAAVPARYRPTPREALRDLEMDMEDAFSRMAQWTGAQLGRPYTFAVACLVVIIWGASGPIFHYSDTWQLVINTGTTIITFLMVFLLQSTQNRDTRVIQLKLDELIGPMRTRVTLCSGSNN
jgi:low affinity Fe/Cu permease